MRISWLWVNDPDQQSPGPGRAPQRRPDGHPVPSRAPDHRTSTTTERNQDHE